MARLQILELPSGINDDRPPFLLVIDQVAPEMVDAITGQERASAELIGARAILSFEETVHIPANDPLPSMESDDAEHASTTQIVYAHERTRLDLCSALLLSGDTTWRKLIETVRERQRELAGLLRERYEPDPKLAAQVLDTLGIEMAPGAPPLNEILFNACRQLQESESARTHLNAERDQLKGATDRVQRVLTKPEIMNAQQEHPGVWMHGYECGVLAAKAALRRRDEPTVKP